MEINITSPENKNILDLVHLFMVLNLNLMSLIFINQKKTNN